MDRAKRGHVVEPQRDHRHADHDQDHRSCPPRPSIRTQEGERQERRLEGQDERRPAPDQAGGDACGHPHVRVAEEEGGVRPRPDQENDHHGPGPWRGAPAPDRIGDHGDGHHPPDDRRDEHERHEEEQGVGRVQDIGHRCEVVRHTGQLVREIVRAIPEPAGADVAIEGVVDPEVARAGDGGELDDEHRDQETAEKGVHQGHRPRWTRSWHRPHRYGNHQIWTGTMVATRSVRRRIPSGRARPVAHATSGASMSGSVGRL